MKITKFIPLISAIKLSCLCTSIFCQVNEDSVMLARSEKWNVKQNKGLFGLSKPAFGPYTTLNINKIDSPVIKKKTKDGKILDYDISSSGADMDQSKLLTIEKTKFYKLQLVTDTNTIGAIFSISSVSKEKRQTLLGKMLSKNDEGKNMVLSYNRDVTGVIKAGIDFTGWEFFIENSTMSGGYLKNEHDSLYMQTYPSFPADLILVNTSGEHLAAIAFKQKHPDIWIRNDISKSYQQAIATFFAVIISIKDF